tara:strand:+ start:148 stop:561 length:414 start_codon:yes stop_codon:yes gene_type:complete
MKSVAKFVVLTALISTSLAAPIILGLYALDQMAPLFEDRTVIVTVVPHENHEFRLHPGDKLIVIPIGTFCPEIIVEEGDEVEWTQGDWIRRVPTSDADETAYFTPLYDIILGGGPDDQFMLSVDGATKVVIWATTTC